MSNPTSMTRGELIAQAERDLARQFDDGSTGSSTRATACLLLTFLRDSCDDNGHIIFVDVDAAVIL